MALSQKKRGGREIRLRPCSGDGEQRIDILLASVRSRYHLAVDGLLARELNLAQEPPDCRVKPQDSSDQFLDHGEDPIAPPDVQQLMAEDGFPGPRVHVRETRRQKHNGAERA